MTRLMMLKWQCNPDVSSGKQNLIFDGLFFLWLVAAEQVLASIFDIDPLYISRPFCFFSALTLLVGLCTM